MLTVALVGIGRMGSHHLDMYCKMIENGMDLRIAAICDVEEDRLTGASRHMFNMGKDNAERSMEDYHKYTSIDDMLANEKPDIVDVIAPTYLHSELSIKALNAGCHVMCEKPMALDEKQCDEMIAAAKRNGKLLMIGQCLHFWAEYDFLHTVAVNKTFGHVKGAMFWRGGFADHEKSPSWQDWIITAEKGGGGLFDQHIHDADFIRWTFGEPNDVCSFARKFFKNSINDIVYTTYMYDDKYIFAQDDISYKGLPFGYGFRVNFETATVELEGGKLTVYPDRSEAYSPDLSGLFPSDDAYYNELCYFIDCVRSGKNPDRCTPEDAKKTVLLVLKEAASAELNRRLLQKEIR